MLRLLNPLRRFHKQCAPRWIHRLANRNEMIIDLPRRSVVPSKKTRLLDVPFSSTLDSRTLRTPATTDTETVAKPNLLRKLGESEEDLRQGEFVAPSFRSKKEISEDRMREVMRKVQKRFECFQIAVVEENDEKYFAKIEDVIDLKVVPTNDWKSVVQREQGIDFKDGELLWRALMLLPERNQDGEFMYTFVFGWDHCCFDGVFMLVGLLDTVGMYLEEATDSDSLSLTPPEIQSMPMVPPREEIFSNILPVTNSDSMKSGEATFDTLRPLALKLADMYKPVSPISGSGLETIIFSREESGRIFTSSKENQLTVNSILECAITMGTYKFLSDKGVLTADVLRYRSYFCVDLRRFADPPLAPNQPGTIMTVCSRNVEVTKDQVEARDSQAFWSLARSIGEETKRILANGPPLEIDLGETQTYCGRNHVQPNDLNSINDLMLTTNLGKIGKSVNLEEIRTVGDAPEMLCFLFLTNNGQLHIELSYWKMFVPDDIAKEFLAAVVMQLRKVL